MKRRGWWRFAVLLVLGVVLSPLRAAAATIPVLSAYDVAVRPTATPVVGRYEAARSEAERPAFNDYDCALVGYGDHSNPPVVRDERADDAYDRAPNLPERCEVGGGVIYDAPAPTTAAEGVEGIALREGEAAASGMQGHHIFPRQMAGQFEAGGINIEEFRVQLNEGTHIDQLHGTGDIPGVGPGGVWNETWRQSFAGEAAAGRAITPQGLLGQAGQMLGDFNVPYYSPLP